MGYTPYPFFSDENLQKLIQEFEVGERRGGVAIQHLIGEILISVAQTGKTPAMPREPEDQTKQILETIWLVRNGFLSKLGILGPYSITPRGLLLLAAQHDSLRHMGRGGYDFWVLRLPREIVYELDNTVAEWKRGNREGFAANPSARKPNPSARKPNPSARKPNPSARKPNTDADIAGRLKF